MERASSRPVCVAASLFSLTVCTGRLTVSALIIETLIPMSTNDRRLTLPENRNSLVGRCPPSPENRNSLASGGAIFD